MERFGWDDIVDEINGFGQDFVKMTVRNQVYNRLLIKTVALHVVHPMGALCVVRLELAPELTGTQLLTPEGRKAKLALWMSV